MDCFRYIPAALSTPQVRDDHGGMTLESTTLSATSHKEPL
ncbi:Protein of unknown function [Pyronema omphalodes CBS 100304]|uniref:Uncharacterized protein n=1 Tax=Pyronema omphalodes (strain CBS 100304) TaxID=1076935 RepID=U4LE76_PYROM|nr:Protein of unknown function [Pyronema omphalodes CBS 100304]